MDAQAAAGTQRHFVPSIHLGQEVWQGGTVSVNESSADPVARQKEITEHRITTLHFASVLSEEECCSKS